MAEKRSRKFGLVTYIQDTAEVLSLLMKKQNSIRAFALIKHDKDEADPHHHIVIRTHCTWTCPQVANWFKDNVEKQNTFAQFVLDDDGIIDYLTHENEEDKYHYSKDDIIDHGLAELVHQNEHKDDSFDIIEDMRNGVSIRAMVNRYGRDFIYHYSHYLLIAEAIKEEEREKQIRQAINDVPAPPNYTK